MNTLQRKTPWSTPLRLFAVVLLVFTLITAFAIWSIGYERIAEKVYDFAALTVADATHKDVAFPEIEPDALSATQHTILMLAKQEFTEQPLGTKYSEGVREEWCADFVSWIMKEAGMPFKNPHSGGWRIPGTYTLQEYYQSENRFKAADSGYEPQPGDVVIYRGSPIFGDHTNIVIENNNGVLVTVGGNEGHRIRVYENTQQQYEGLLGYGILDTE